MCGQLKAIETVPNHSSPPPPEGTRQRGVTKVAVDVVVVVVVEVVQPIEFGERGVGCQAAELHARIVPPYATACETALPASA